jgi:hypothetical protein
MSEEIKKLLEIGTNNPQLVFALALAAKFTQNDSSMNLEEATILQEYAKKILPDVGIKFDTNSDNIVTKLTFHQTFVQDNPWSVEINPQDLTGDLTGYVNRFNIFDKLTRQQKEVFSYLGSDLTKSGNEESKLLATALAYVTREYGNFIEVLEKKNEINNIEKALADEIDRLLPNANIKYSSDGNSIDGIERIKPSLATFEFTEGNKPIIKARK